MTLRCYLCQETFSSRKHLLTHERTKHRNNKTIPHLHLLLQPSFEQLISYQDAFIILIKKRLGLIGSGRQGNGQHQQNDSCRAYQAFHDWSSRRQSSPSGLGHRPGRVALICIEEDKSCVIITSLQ